MRAVAGGFYARISLEVFNVFIHLNLQYQAFDKPLSELAEACKFGTDKNKLKMLADREVSLELQTDSELRKRHANSPRLSAR